jgi:hypothetical protein
MQTAIVHQIRRPFAISHPDYPYSRTTAICWLEDFLATIKPYRDKGRAATDKANKAIDDYNANKTTDQLHKLGDIMEQVGYEIDDVANEMATVTPPPSLDHAYTGWVEYSTQLAGIVQGHGLRREARQPRRPQRRPAEDRPEQGRRIQGCVDQTVDRDGINVPLWIKDMGSSD